MSLDISWQSIYLNKLMFEKCLPSIIFLILTEQVKLFHFLVCDNVFVQQFNFVEKYEDMLTYGRSHV